MTRPSWPLYFMTMLDAVKQRSNCSRRKVGAIITKNNVIVSTGYNGMPAGMPNCFEGGCARCADQTIKSGEALDNCGCEHAELNAILYAEREAVRGAELWLTHSPCYACSRSIAAMKISKVHYVEEYPGIGEVKAYLNLAGIPCEPILVDFETLDEIPMLKKDEKNEDQ